MTATSEAKQVGKALVVEQRRPGGSIWYRQDADGWAYTTDHKADAPWHPINAIYLPREVLRAAAKAKDASNGDVLDKDREDYEPHGDNPQRVVDGELTKSKAGD